MNVTASEVFKRTTRGVNIMTPHVMHRGRLAGNAAYELAQGRGFSGEDIYGVTVRGLAADGTPDRRYDDLSRLFWLRVDAEREITRLKRLAAAGTLFSEEETA